MLDKQAPDTEFEPRRSEVEQANSPKKISKTTELAWLGEMSECIQNKTGLDIESRVTDTVRVQLN